MEHRRKEAIGSAMNKMIANFSYLKQKEFY